MRLKCTKYTRITAKNIPDGSILMGGAFWLPGEEYDMNRSEAKALLEHFGENFETADVAAEALAASLTQEDNSE